jgi:NAD(P)-dependent dehydrogenase (short-subunit alcohol dehydrogenase family)
MATVMITGGAGGIGTSLAALLAGRGDTAIIADLDGDLARAKAAAIEGADSIQVDVTDPDACQRAVETVVDRHGSLNGLACCAGILAEFALPEEYPTEQFRRSLDVNLNGSFFAAQAAARAMVAAGDGGAIVLTSSGMASRAVTFADESGRRLVSPGYGASKAAVEAIGRELGVALAPQGIRVNVVSPGMIATEMSREAREDPEYLAIYSDHTALGRVGEPEELAAVMAFLLGEGSSYMSATVVPVDGGYLAV